jgi:hypothetical protein
MFSSITELKDKSGAFADIRTPMEHSLDSGDSASLINIEIAVLLLERQSADP